MVAPPGGIGRANAPAGGGGGARTPLLTANVAGANPGIAGGSGRNTFGGAGTGLGGVALTATGCCGGGGVGATGSGGGGMMFGEIVIGGGGGVVGPPGGVVVTNSRVVPHGCSTLPLRIVTGTDAVS